jgi:hypothetical protein
MACFDLGGEQPPRRRHIQEELGIQSYWRTGRRIDLADRTKTVLDLNKFTESAAAASPCVPDQESCFSHPTAEMIQVFSLRLAKPPVSISSDSGGWYGYIAARDWTKKKKEAPVEVERLGGVLPVFFLALFSKDFLKYAPGRKI